MTNNWRRQSRHYQDGRRWRHPSLELYKREIEIITQGLPVWQSRVSSSPHKSSSATRVARCTSLLPSAIQRRAQGVCEQTTHTSIHCKTDVIKKQTFSKIENLIKVQWFKNVRMGCQKLHICFFLRLYEKVGITPAQFITFSKGT